MGRSLAWTQALRDGWVTAQPEARAVQAESGLGHTLAITPLPSSLTPLELRGVFCPVCISASPGAPLPASHHFRRSNRPHHSSLGLHPQVGRLQLCGGRGRWLRHHAGRGSDYKQPGAEEAVPDLLVVSGGAPAPSAHLPEGRRQGHTGS